MSSPALDDIAVWHRQAQESLRNGPQFIRENREGFYVLRQRSPEGERAVERLLADPDQAFTGKLILKPGSRSHLEVICVAGKPYVLKRYNCRGTGYRLMNAFRRSRALRTWLIAWEYLVRGISVPQPLVCLEERHMRLLGRSYVLMEFFDGAVTLRNAWINTEQDERKKLSVQLGSYLGHMHRTGMVHGDLKWDNILLGLQNGTHQLHLVDLDASRVVKNPSSQVARADIERFLRDMIKEGCSEHERCIFLDAWEVSFKKMEAPVC